jgi:hypothetical protein
MPRSLLNSAGAGKGLLNLNPTSMTGGEAILLNGDHNEVINVSMKTNTGTTSTLNDTDLVLISDGATGKILKYIAISDFKNAGTLWTLSGVNIFADGVSSAGDVNLLLGTESNSDTDKFLCSGKAQITGNLKIGSNLTVDGTSTLSSEVTIGNGYSGTGITLENTGKIKTKGNLIIDGQSTLSSEVQIGTGYSGTGITFENTGKIKTKGNLIIDGQSTLSSEVQIGTGYSGSGITLENTGKIKTKGNLIIDGQSTLSSEVQIGTGYSGSGITLQNTGNLSMKGNLVVDGTATIGGDLFSKDWTRGSGNLYPTNVGDTILSNDGYINDSEADDTYVNVFKMRNTNSTPEVASFSFYIQDSGDAGSLKFEVDYEDVIKEIYNVGKDGIMNIPQGTTFTGGYGSTGLTIYTGGHLSMNGNLVVSGTSTMSDKVLITDIANSTYVEVFEMKNTNDGGEVASFSYYVKDSGNDGVIKFEVDYKSAVKEVYYIEKTGIMHINQGLKIIDDISITFGNDDNYTIEYDENGFNHLVLRSKKDTDFNLQWASDASDDNTDNYTWYIPVGGSYLGCYSYLGGGWGNSMFNLVPQGTRADDYAEVKNIKVNKYLFTDEIKTMTGDIAIEPTADLNLQSGVDLNLQSARILTIKSPSRCIARAQNGFVAAQNDNTWGAAIMIGDEVLTNIAVDYPNAGASRRRSFWFGVEQSSGSWRALGIGVNLTNNDDNPTLGYEDTQLLGFFNPARNGAEITFTAYHLCSTVYQDEFIDDNIGLVVESTGIYDSLDPLSGVLPNQIDNIMISESVPQVQLTTTSKSKKVFGVIAKVEKTGEHRHNNISSMFVGVVSKDRNRYNINSIGEGAIWVSNEGGNLENGDLLCSSSTKGYAMKQDDDLVHNYTIGKITMDCSFDMRQKKKYKTRKIDDLKYAFCGCVYMCG